MAKKEEVKGKVRGQTAVSRIVFYCGELPR